jgi:hypothetical protein
MTNITQNLRALAPAHWLATTPTDQKPRPIIPALRQRFGLAALEAAQAAAEVAHIRRR